MSTNITRNDIARVALSGRPTNEIGKELGVSAERVLESRKYAMRVVFATFKKTMPSLIMPPTSTKAEKEAIDWAWWAARFEDVHRMRKFKEFERELEELLYKYGYKINTRDVEVMQAHKVSGGVQLKDCTDVL